MRVSVCNQWMRIVYFKLYLCKTTYNHYTHEYTHADNQTYIQKRRGKRISEKKRKGTDTLLNMFFDSGVGCKCMCVFVNIKHMFVCDCV